MVTHQQKYNAAELRARTEEQERRERDREGKHASADKNSAASSRPFKGLGISSWINPTTPTNGTSGKARQKDHSNSTKQAKFGISVSRLHGLVRTITTLSSSLPMQVGEARSRAGDESVAILMMLMITKFHWRSWPKPARRARGGEDGSAAFALIYS